MHTLSPSKIRTIFTLFWTLLFLVACQASLYVTPPPLIPNNRNIEAIPAHVAGGLDPQKGFRFDAVVQSPTELVVTVQVLRPSDINTMVVRQKFITLEAISSEALRTDAVLLESKILSDFDEGMTFATPATAIEVSSESLSDWDSLTIPSENIFTFTVSLHPIEPNQAYAVLIERFHDQELRARHTSIFVVSGKAVLQ